MKVAAALTLKVLDDVAYGPIELTPHSRGGWSCRDFGYTDVLDGWDGEAQIVISRSAMQSGTVSVVVLEIYCDSPIKVKKFKGKWDDADFYERVRDHLQKLVGGE